jgi:serine/threonine-protein kinase
LTIGTTFANRYRIDAPLGTGGVATVYRGTDLTLQRPVAIKILRPELASDPEAVARFRREAYNAAKLNHPNIVQIYDTGVEGSDYYIVMEYLSEPDLKKILQEYAPLPLRKVVEVATQCCKALAYAHRQGIVHRDVKPHNILFTDDGVAKLSDFGIAAAAGAPGLTSGGMVLGTAHYISPEQAQGHPVGPHSDIYSLGCIMYECLTGHTPFSGDEAAQVAAKHVRERPAPMRTYNPGVSPSAEFVVNKAMARDVARRYRTAEEMLGDLEKLAEGATLDRTGTLPQPEGATMVLTAAPAAPTLATVPQRPVARPGTTQGAYSPTSPVRAAHRQQESNGPLVAGLIIALIVAIVAVAGAFWFLKKAFNSNEQPKTVQVPAVQGHSETEAKNAIIAAGLRVGNITYQYNDTYPQGTVLDQTPAMGETVQPNAQVSLVINRGKEQVAVIDVTDETLDRAKRKLEQAGLTLGDVTKKFSDKAADTVIRQLVAPGTRVEKGTPVDLEVSKGPETVPPQGTTPPAVEPSAEGAAQEPDVTVTPDASYSSSNPAKRRYVVKVTAQGSEKGQLVEVVKRDDAGGRVVVMSATMDPGSSKEVLVNATGNVTLEVLQDKKSVFQQRYAAESSGRKTP